MTAHPQMAKSARFDPNASMLGGFQPLDGTIEFYGRIRAVLRRSDVVIDLGAGRAAWFYDDTCETRRRLRDLRGAVARVIGVDVDPVVLTNPTTTENRLIEGGRLPMDDASVDAIVADYVLEHIEDVRLFCAEVDRVLRPGGFLCARTPHKYQYVAIASRMAKGGMSAQILSKAQPSRKTEDAFPTVYHLNTLRELRAAFPRYEDYSYLYAPEPAYYFGRKSVFRALSTAQRLMPRVLSSNIFVFMRKAM